MAINYKAKITDLLESANLFYSLWNEPTRTPHKVCISDDTSMNGNACGKLVIGGKTWREVFETLEAIAITPDMIAGRKLHEVPDNWNGKMLALTDIQYDYDADEYPDHLPTKMIVVVPKNIKTTSEAENFLSDYISDKTGYCHFGFTIVPPLNTLFRQG